MKKIIISAVIILSLVFAVNAIAAPPQMDCCGGSASGSATMGSSCCCSMHNDMIAMMANMIDIQKELIVTLKDGPKKQELQKKVAEMENTLKQVMRSQNSQNCCGGMMQNMPDNMPMKNMPMHQ